MIGEDVFGGILLCPSEECLWRRRLGQMTVFADEVASGFAPEVAVESGIVPAALEQLYLGHGVRRLSLSV